MKQIMAVIARSPEGATKAGAPAPALNRNPLTVPSKDGTKQSAVRRLLRLHWVLCLAMTTFATAQAGEVAATGGEIKMVTKNMAGEVGARGANGIALVYEKNKEKRSSSEMWFPYEKDMKLEKYGKATDIGEGDRVIVTYLEAEDGSKRLLKKIALLEKAPKEEEPKEEEDEEEEVAGNE